MRRTLEKPVIVITGASSGIGRATARAFAQEGANLVLAARREGALVELADDLRTGEDVNVETVPTDVTALEEVERLAEHAMETFGHIDVWVNNAAVTAFGRFEDIPPGVFDRVLDTNLRGYVNGARAAFPRFREHDAGVLINVGSMVSRVGQPYTTPYVTSKWGIRGFSECLRMETLGSDIDVSTILPASIDTPLFQNGANYVGKKAKAMEPVYPARDVAEAIVATAKNPHRGERGPRHGHAVAPSIAERRMAKQVREDHFQDVPAPEDDGNLFEPKSETATVSGGWGEHERGGKVMALAGGLALGLGAAAVFLWRR